MTRNFSISEFACKSGAPTPADVRANLQILAENLQVLRDEIGMPISINSGYRSPAHNQRVGGAANSTHLRGLAADIRCAMPPAQLAATIERLIASGRMKQGGLKAYNSFVHYDCAGKRRRW
jgi:uncharacterized protein YcbK (DUF882 family)